MTLMQTSSIWLAGVPLHTTFLREPVELID